MYNDAEEILVIGILAVAVAALVLMLRRAWKDTAQHKARADKWLHEKYSLQKQIKEAAARQGELQANFNSAVQILKETSVFYPSLAEAVCDFHRMQSEKAANQLETKKHPARSAAEQVREEANKRRTAERQLHQLKYQLLTYEAMFPWLLEVAGRSTNDILAEWQARKDGIAVVAETADQREPDRKWLSPEEYAALPTAQRADLALQRWKDSRRTSAWEAGRDYERFVGFMLEQEGYRVSYWGATMGFEDMGRDLIATNGHLTKIIQCKRWSSDRTIHEKHIFQLIGTALEYACLHHGVPMRGIDLQNQGVIPALVTSTSCSEKAREVANVLGVELRETYALAEYPIVKCNVSGHSGEKIYHLPFDQQYDRIRIQGEKGELYVSSAAEAEARGFRRAHRYLGPERSSS